MDEDDPLVALRNARSRFIAGFHGQCDSLEALTVAAAPGGNAPRRAAARQLAHRIVGLAGTIGFKSLSTRAAELESLLTSGAIRSTLTMASSSPGRFVRRSRTI